ncbi:MAG: mandelate racemase/muconate lactonizing protein [Chloroflexi bacterium OLB15]|nr:MAG: mandelate racemase/muconate lactonizing protein [Chloroflexi bacterium OLB15]
MRSITVKSIEQFSIAMPFVEKLRTSFGEEPFKTAVLIRITTEDGLVGWGEAPVEIHPGYSSETMGTADHVLREFLIPALLGKTVQSPTDVPELLSHTRGHPLAKHSLEQAVWDAWSQANGLSIAQAFAYHLPAGNEGRGVAKVGVSIGIKPTIEETIAVISKRLGEGYARIKLKIMPGWDVELARAVRAQFPDILLMLDANSAYTLADTEHLKQVDDLNLLMLEQPLGYFDIYEHSKLQPQLKTSICLDESIHSADDARLAFELGACRIINLKPSRVSGFTESLEIYKVCVENNAPLWIGGMMETGIGRAANAAFASLPGVTLPCDISATNRYFVTDLTEPPFELQPDSTLRVPTGLGLGVQVFEDRVARAVALWQQEYPYSE